MSEHEVKIIWCDTALFVAYTHTPAERPSVDSHGADEEFEITDVRAMTHLETLHGTPQRILGIFDHSAVLMSELVEQVEIAHRKMCQESRDDHESEARK